MDKVLIIGGGGQLGQCLKKVAASNETLSIIFPPFKTAEILNENSLEALFKEHQPNYVVNCSAYTAVDLAEDEVDQAKAVNDTAVGLLAMVCKKHQAKLLHVSTDFVFEGNVVTLLKEDDLAEPINVYGATKLAGEHTLAATMDEYFIIRTSWLYSEYANNFVKTMLRLGADRPELNIIADQVGTPTYAIDLAQVILDIIKSKSTAYGTYHYSNEGVVSWFDFAKAIFDISGTATEVKPIPSHAYPTKAKRPSFSVMDKSKIKDTFGIKVPYWRDRLIHCIAVLKAQNV